MLKKQFFSIAFLLLFLLSIVKPIIPYMIYYANYEEIVTEKCVNKDKPEMNCHGKCQLKKLKKQIQPIQQDKPITNSPSQIKDLPVFIHQEAYKSILVEYILRVKNPNFQKHFLISNYSASIFHPPDLVS